jgi:hypothetical protein
MKKLILIITLFISSFIRAQDDATFNLVVKKLNKDEISYKQFVSFGETNCLRNKTKTLFDEYGKAYNSFYPLPRLIKLKSLEKSFYTYEKNLVIENKNRKKKCSCAYKENNEQLKLIYINLINNIKNYNEEPEYDIENYMKDYLDSYFIKIPTE